MHVSSELCGFFGALLFSVWYSFSTLIFYRFLQQMTWFFCICMLLKVWTNKPTSFHHIFFVQNTCNLHRKLAFFCLSVHRMQVPTSFLSVLCKRERKTEKNVQDHILFAWKNALKRLTAKKFCVGLVKEGQNYSIVKKYCLNVEWP